MTNNDNKLQELSTEDLKKVAGGGGDSSTCITSGAFTSEDKCPADHPYFWGANLHQCCTSQQSPSQNPKDPSPFSYGKEQFR